MVAHISFAEPFCPDMSRVLAEGSEGQGIPTHQGATLVVMEGPAFSTKAESEMYRAWGGDLIGMTALPEAKLAREAEICYATMAWVTDYDCWHPEHDAVTVEMVVENSDRQRGQQPHHSAPHHADAGGAWPVRMPDGPGQRHHHRPKPDTRRSAAEAVSHCRDTPGTGPSLDSSFRRNS